MTQGTLRAAALSAVAVAIVVVVIELVRTTTLSITSGMRLRSDAFGATFIALLFSGVVVVFVITRLWNRRRK